MKVKELFIIIFGLGTMLANILLILNYNDYYVRIISIFFLLFVHYEFILYLQRKALLPAQSPDSETLKYFKEKLKK